jgi:hypothetical protein
MDNNDLHLMVGEIRADVKSLLSAKGDTQKRVAKLENSFSYYRGALWIIGFIVTGVVIPLAKNLLF